MRERAFWSHQMTFAIFFVCLWVLTILQIAPIFKISVHKLRVSLNFLRAWKFLSIIPFSATETSCTRLRFRLQWPTQSLSHSLILTLTLSLSLSLPLPPRYVHETIRILNTFLLSEIYIFLTVFKSCSPCANEHASPFLQPPIYPFHIAVIYHVPLILTLFLPRISIYP